jgi:hypothetical protein
MPVSIRADSPSPPSISHEPGNTEMLSMSPPHDVKMRHISQRVEHIGWKNGETPTPESVLQPSISRELGKVSQPPPRAVSPSPQKDEEEAPRRGSMESIINTGMSPPIPPPSTTPLTPPEDPSPTILDDSQDDNKRRSMESIISQGGTKRPRDEEEGDVNPRVAKRPSPPPEKKEEPKPAAPSTPAPASKMVSGFQVGSGMCSHVHTEWFHVLRINSIPLCRCKRIQPLQGQITCTPNQSATLFLP